MLLCAAIAVVVALAGAAPAGSVRSPKGAKPSVRILTKDQAQALKTGKIALRVGVGAAPARVRLRVLGLNLGRRPVRIVKERKVSFRASHSRVFNVKLTKEARGLLTLMRAACRDAALAAFASGRQTPGHDSPRTTLVRHARTLAHGRKNCSAGGTGSPTGSAGPGVSGPAGVPGSPGSTPGLGGPSLDPPGTPPPGSTPPTTNPPKPTDPITIRAGAADADATPPVGTPMFAYTARSNVFGADPPTPAFDPEQPPGPNNPSLPAPEQFLQYIADAAPDENLYAKSFQPSQGIHTRLRARAIVIESGGKKYALAMVDLGGHPYSFTKEVLNRISGLGISGDRLLLSSTHTHSSSGAVWSADNNGYAFVGGDAYDPRVFEMVVSGVVEAIAEANRRLQPARIGVGTAQLSGASRNREHTPFKRNPEATPAEKDSGNEAVDKRVTAIRVDDAQGAPIAVWSNFAVHPTSFGDDNLLFSGDNAATAERLVEEELLRDAAGRGITPKTRPVDVWTNGTEGDVSPDGGVERDPTVPGDDAHSRLQQTTNGFGEANSTGRKVSAGILAAWRDAGAHMSGSPGLDSRQMFMDFDGRTVEGDKRTSPYPVLGAGGIVAEEGDKTVFEGQGCAPADDFTGPGQGRKFPIVGGPGLAPNQHPISMMRIGPLALAAWPSEITTVTGRRMKAAVAAVAGAQAPAGVAIAGLTNSYNSYTATPDEYDYCSYEGSFTLWGRHQGLYYRELAGGLARSLYGGAPLPAGAPEPPTASPGTAQPPAVHATPDASSIVTNAPASVDRLGLATFKWNGGDPAVDAPRTKAFVSLEYKLPDGKFTTVSTDDSVLDTTMHGRDDTWTETWQFTECDALGTYRFHVRGRAVKDGPTATSYDTFSREFQPRPATIKSYSTTVSDGAVHVRAEYQGLPANSLAALSRRVRHGVAVVRVTKPGGAVEEVFASPDSRGLEFRASVPNGSTAKVVSIVDGCLNTGS